MKNFFAYIRVSTAKQGQLGSSLQEQRDAISAFAARYEFTISEWFEDRETAAKKGRTEFVRMMTALEKGKAAGVILHKIDRGARNLWDWARLQDLIDAGVSVRFAHDDLDLKSRGGRLAADIQAVVAADYVRNLRDEVRKGIRGRLKQGLYPGRAPIGYLDQGKARPKTIDPIKGPLVRAAFELYASRAYSYKTLANELNRRGLRGLGGGPISKGGTATILTNPFYVGTIHIRRTGETFEGVHEPLIDTQLFRTVQAVITGKINTKTRSFDFLYRRLLTCGYCGRMLTGELQKGHTYYRCHRRGCETKGIREEDVTRQLAEALGRLQGADWDIAAMSPYFEELQARDADWREAQVKACRLRIDALVDRERRLTDAFIDQAIDRETYNARRKDLLLELSVAREEGAGARSQVEPFKKILEKFFEPIKRLHQGLKNQLARDIRETVLTLTSNRAIRGKNLELTMSSPFDALSNDQPVFFGPPYRDSFRTLPATVHEQRARALYALLKDWRPLGYEPLPKRTALPHAFKPKGPPQVEGHP